MGINPIQNVIPTQNTQNFMQDYLQGLKYGQELQAMQKQNELLKKQELFKQDYATLSQNPSGQGMLNLMVKYPEFAAQLKPVQEAFGTAEKQGELSQLMQLDNALYNNNVDLANTIVDNTIKAFENSGRPTAQLQTIKQLIEKDPTQAAGATSQALAMLLGDKYKTYEEGRIIFLQRGSDVKKAEGQATKAVAEGKTAQVDMEVKIATKAAEIERLRALSEKAKSDADKASIEAQIAVATKDLTIAEQEHKTSTEKSKAEQEAIKLEFLPKEKKLGIEKQGYDIKKVIADIALTKESTKLKTLEVELSKAEKPLKIAKLKGEVAKVKNEISEKVKEKVFDFENTISTYNNTINTIDKILDNSQLDRVLGPFDGRVPGVNATQNDAIANIETLQSQVFLSQVKELKGTGALSDAEGKKLDSSLASLSRTQSVDQFKNNVKEIKKLMMKGIENTSNKYGMKPKIERPNLKTNSAEVDAILKKYGVK